MGCGVGREGVDVCGGGEVVEGEGGRYLYRGESGSLGGVGRGEGDGKHALGVCRVGAGGLVYALQVYDVLVDGVYGILVYGVLAYGVLVYGVLVSDVLVHDVPGYALCAVLCV